MKKNQTFSSKLVDALYDHPILLGSLKNAGAVFVLIFSAFVFALGYKCFLAPNRLISASGGTITKLLSGGISGISQLVIMFISVFPNNFLIGNPHLEDIVFSACYFLLNVPVFLIAWKGIGKRFTIFTFLNVMLVSLFSNLLGIWDDGWVTELARFVNDNGGMLSRAVFAGVCTGISSGLAYKVDGSGGGIDVISYFIALKKGVLVGKYNVLINACTLFLFTFLGCYKVWTGIETVPNSMEFVAMAFFSILYLMVTSAVIDVINIRNKKVKIEAISSNPDLAKVIISTLPHGATVFHGSGAFTGKDRYAIQIVVSSYEVKQAIHVISEADPNAFIEVSELKQVYGRFFLPPIR
ncbi:MAG: YitT family protein [Candidatus Enteromonas sp.]|nr:YitT family protein [Candidatus Enteromonas sp.]